MWSPSLERNERWLPIVAGRPLPLGRKRGPFTTLAIVTGVMVIFGMGTVLPTMMQSFIEPPGLSGRA